MSIVNTFKHQDDFWYTPEPIKKATLRLVPGGTKTILDPCAGQGDLCDFDKYTYTLYDLNPRKEDIQKKDFFDLTKNDVTEDCIVMNPPFSIGRKFIDHAIDLCDKVIVIAPFSVVKPYASIIQGWTGEFWWASAFGITFPLGAFYLNRNKPNLSFLNLFYQELKDPLTRYPRTKDVDMKGKKGLVFYTTILGTYHGFTEIDPRTGYEYWCTPITEETKQETLDFLTYYTTNCKGHKKGEEREACFFVPYENPMRAYEYFTKSFPTTNWYRVTGLNNKNWIDTYLPDTFEKTFGYEPNTHTYYMENYGKKVSVIGRTQ